MISFTIATPVFAKNTKHVACTANETGDGWNCDSGEGATAARAAAPAPAEVASPTAPATPKVTPAPAAAAAAAITVPGAAQVAEPAPAAVPAAAPTPAPAPSLSPAAAPAAEPAPVEEALAEPVSLPIELVLDWQALELVPTAQRDLDCLLCSGRYLDPLADADTQADPEESDINAWANSTELQGDFVKFSGGVNVTQGYRHFRGDEATINRLNGEAVLTGKVTLREPGVLLQGSRADIFTQSGEATLENSLFVLHPNHLQGEADLLERDADGMVHVHDGKFSYCPPGEEDWFIHAKKIDLDLVEGLGTAHHATVDIAGLPVFYTPWLQFPLDDRRRTGLLWPDFGNDSTGGLDITAPLYLNLAPNYDALYSPRYIQERGVNHELKTRYLNKYLGYWTVGGTYMSSDKRYKDQVQPGESDDRWLAIIRQDGLLNQRWLSHVDYSKASDVDYMKDLETSSLTAQRRTSLLQSASMDYLGDSWLVNMNVEQYQSLADDINDVYKKLPQLTGQYRSSGAPFEIQPILLSQYSNFGADEDVVTGERIYTEGGAAYPMNWAYGFLKPTVKYRQLNYNLSNDPFYTEDTPAAGSAMGSVDGGLYFERETSFAGESLLQTLEPRLYYLYSGYENQDDQPDFDTAELTFSYNQLFRETRFSGHDRIDDANRLSMGVSSQFIDTHSGQKLLGASIGQIFYFKDRKVRLLPGAPPLDESSSEIAADLSFTPDKYLSLRTDLVYDPHSGNMNSGNVLAGYTTDNGTIFNLGYAYNRQLQVNQALNQLLPQTEQVTASTFLPVDTNWRLFGAINYSIIDNTAIEQMLGVEYENCCWIVRMMHLRYYDNDTSGFFPDFNNPDLQQEHTTQVQFVLKGMGGFGSRITNILEDMIRGYQEREY